MGYCSEERIENKPQNNEDDNMSNRKEHTSKRKRYNIYGYRG